MLRTLKYLYFNDYGLDYFTVFEEAREKKYNFIEVLFKETYFYSDREWTQINR